MHLRWLAATIAIAAAFVATRYGYAHIRSRTASVSSETFSEVIGHSEVDEFVLVFIASAACRACSDPELPYMVDDARKAISAQARTVGVRTRMIGIGVDLAAGASIESLARFGSFDEMLVGGGWSGTGMMYYIWDGMRGSAGVPQIMVFYRRLVAANADVGIAVQPQLLARAVGLDELGRWRASGFPIEKPRVPERAQR